MKFFLCTYVCSFFNIQQLKCAISPNFTIAKQYSAKQYSATTTAPIFEYMALLESYEQAGYFSRNHIENRWVLRARQAKRCT